MPCIKDPRVLEGRRNRNRKVRKMYDKMNNDHRTFDYIVDCIIKEFGISEGTIIKIINKEGSYAEQ